MISLIVLASLAELSAAAGTHCWFQWQCAGKCNDSWQCEDAPNNHRCLLHDDCASHYCAWDFKCHAKYNDGHDMGLPLAIDYRPCKSGKGKCSICGGGKLKNGQRCQWWDNCQSGFCHNKIGITSGCLGTCKDKFGEGHGCKIDAECKSGYCRKYLDLVDEQKDGIVTPVELIKEAFDFRCRTLKNDGEWVGFTLLGHSFKDECKSKKAQCGTCVSGDHQLANGKHCWEDSNCKSGLCIPDDKHKLFPSTYTCGGHCGEPGEEGEYLGLPNPIVDIFTELDYGKYCKSRKGVCGTCTASRKNGVKGACSTNNDCKAGLFCGRKHDFQVFDNPKCEGECKPMINDGEECDNWLFDGNDIWSGEDDSCKSGDCHVFGNFKLGSISEKGSYCKPKGGFIDNMPCMVDGDCHPDYWCENGHVIHQIGTCQRCPGWCGKNGRERGCAMCQNAKENMQCGRFDWGETTSCLIRGAPTFWKDVGTSLFTCIATIGDFGQVGQQNRACPTCEEEPGILGNQNLLAIAKDCFKDKELCNIELWHDEKGGVFHAKKSVDPLLLTDGKETRRRLADGAGLTAAEQGPLAKMFRLGDKASARFGFGSMRRRVEVSDDKTKGRLLSADDMTEVLEAVDKDKRERIKQDMEAYVESRKKVLDRDVQKKYESENFDGLLNVAETMDLLIDPDFVINPLKGTMKGHVGVSGHIEAALDFKGTAGKVTVEYPLTGVWVWLSQVVTIGNIPVPIEIFQQIFVEITADIKMPVDAELLLDGDIDVKALVDIDLGRKKVFDFNGEAGSGNELTIEPRTRDGNALKMNLSVRLVHRLTFVVLTNVAFQYDITAGVQAKLDLQHVAGKGKDCLTGDVGLTSLTVGHHPVAAILGVDVGRMTEGFCIASAYSLYSRFSKIGLKALAIDCVAKAFLRKSGLAEWVEMCMSLNGIPDIHEIEENALSVLDMGWSKIWEAVDKKDMKRVGLNERVKFCGEFEGSESESDDRSLPLPKETPAPTLAPTTGGRTAAPTTPARKCANEGSKCTCTGTVVYGAGDMSYSEMLPRVVVKNYVSGTFPCTNKFFGEDPVHRVYKKCLCFDGWNP